MIMRLIVTAGAVLFALLLIIVPPAPGGAPDSRQEQYTGITWPIHKIISNPAEFESTWNAVLHGQPAPRVDFQNEFAACICLGERKSGGYRVVFEGEYPRGDKLIVAYWEKDPSGFVTQALTQPCAVKIFRRRPGLEPELQKVKTPEK
jgi:hypothetical protein